MEDKEATRRWKDLPCSRLRKINRECACLTKSNVQVQHNSNQNSRGILNLEENINFNFYTEISKTTDSQNNLSKMNQRRCY